MTENNLSEKLFKQKDGKLFAYADEIKKAIKKLKEKFNDRLLFAWECEQIDKIFGKKLI